MKIKINKQLILEANRFEKHLKNKPISYQMDKRRELNSSLHSSVTKIPQLLGNNVNKFNGLNLYQLRNEKKLDTGGSKINNKFASEAKIVARKNNNDLIKQINKQKTVQKTQNSYKKPKDLNDQTKGDVRIIHGGSFNNLNRTFKNNKSPDKNIDNGLWIHPEIKGNGVKISNVQKEGTLLNKKHNYYAGRALARGDAPAEMTGKINIDNLTNVSNGYEGIIPKGNMKQVKDLKIRKLPISDDVLAGSPGALVDEYDKYVKKYG